MVIFRLFSVVLVVLALMLLGADVVSTLEKNGEAVIRSLDQILLLMRVDATPWLQQKLPPQAANVGVAILSWPGWAVLGVPGTLLGMLTGVAPWERRRVPPPPSAPINR